MLVMVLTVVGLKAFGVVRQGLLVASMHMMLVVRMRRVVVARICSRDVLGTTNQSHRCRLTGCVHAVVASLCLYCRRMRRAMQQP